MLLVNHVCDQVAFNNATQKYTSQVFLGCESGFLDITTVKYGICKEFYHNSNLLLFFIDNGTTSDCDYSDEVKKTKKNIVLLIFYIDFIRFAMR